MVAPGPYSHGALLAFVLNPTLRRGHNPMFCSRSPGHVSSGGSGAAPSGRHW